MPFLSLLDERARPKGSRDPLGFEMVWTYFGRRVVVNLTTITSSWQIFSVGLLGFHWSNQLCQNAHPADKQSKLQEHFIRYEQLAAYLRCHAGNQEIMGITRVRSRLNKEGAHTIGIGTEQQNLILSDQISYGIWGLYSTAMRETGLIRGDERELTPEGLAIVSLMEKQLSRSEKGLGRDWYWGFLRGDRRSANISELDSEAKVFLNAITQAKVKDKLIRAVLNGSGKHPCQSDLYKACKLVDQSILRDAKPGDLIGAIQRQTDSAVLKQALSDISQLERLLVSANTLFEYCRRKDGELLSEVASAIDEALNFDFLPEGPQLADCPYSEDLERLRFNLRRKDILTALRCLLDMNKKIMKGRGGAAWVEETSDGRLRVRVGSETAHLPSQADLQSRWDYDYFLRSYARIAGMERR